ncbi:hypothetical protein [Bartonella sp. OT172YNZD]|uniref:hypothetical protein n=1 Tax=Bartonella sp. OT172YNZD TaxID=3243572 RepID=UPI0035D03B68
MKCLRGCGEVSGGSVEFFREIIGVENPFRNGSGEWYNGKAPMKCIKFIEHVHLYVLKKSKPVPSHTLLAPKGVC